MESVSTTPPPTAPASSLTEAILDSVSDGVFSVDSDWRIRSFNRAAEEIIGASRSEAIGRPCRDVLRANICSEGCALRYTLETGCPVVHCEIVATRSDGRSVPLSISTALLRDAGGKVIGAVETFRDLSTVVALREQVRERFRLHDMVSQNPRMRQLFDILPTIATSDSTVLIEGESGTGKELLARAIHLLSERKHKPFVSLNCGAVPETLLESELFGFRAGAFTGATRDRAGRIAAADGGTLLFDEIGETSPTMQVKLLRVIQEREYQPVGDDRTRSVNVRFLAATNHDLADDVRTGRFRTDLYYRLNVIRLELPPLRERPDDILLLAEELVARFAARLDKPITGLSPQVTAALMAHSYPGNVRELENIVEHACVLCPSGVILLDHLPSAVQPAAVPDQATLGERLRRLEAEIIRQALARNAGNRTRAAKELGIHRVTLQKKIAAHGLTQV